MKRQRISLILFLATLVVVINAGFYSSAKSGDVLVNPARPESVNSIDSATKDFLCTVSDIRTPFDPSPCNNIKVNKKAKYISRFNLNSLIVSGDYPPYNTFYKDPLMLSDLFSSSDINLPFRYFW